MSGWVLAQQLISRRTLTRFSYATLLSWVSMSAQYLQEQPRAQASTQGRPSGFTPAAEYESESSSLVPFRVRELHGGEVVHDGDVNEAPGVLHDAEDGLEVLSPASCTERWRGALSERGSRCGSAADLTGLLPQSKKGLTDR